MDKTTPKKKKKLTKAELEKRSKVIRGAIAGILAAGIVGLGIGVYSGAAKAKDGMITAEKGNLYLVDIHDKEKKIKVTNANGGKIDYNFNENTVALVGTEDGVTEPGKKYEVMLFNDDGITYGYIDGKFLSNTVLDSTRVLNTNFDIRKITEDNVNLRENTNESNDALIKLYNNQNVLASEYGFCSDENSYIWNEVITVDGNDIKYGYVASDYISGKKEENEPTIENIIEEHQNEEIDNDNTYYVTTKVGLNIRKSPDVNSEKVESVAYGEYVTQIDDEEYEDGKYKWIHIKYINNKTNETKEGWVAAVDYTQGTEISYLSNGKITKESLADTLSSVCAVAIDADTNEVLFDKNKDQLMSPASITKILTAHVVSKYGNLDDKISYSKSAINCEENGENQAQNGYATSSTSPVYDIVKENNVISVRDALHISILLSDNSTTKALSEYIKTITGRNFCDLMNEEAKIMGCEYSNFSNSFGFDGNHGETDHLVTAYDMAKIESYIARNDQTTYEIMGKQNYNLEYDGRTISHISCFIKPCGYYDETVKGCKTGSTDKAGETLVTLYERNGKRIVVVTLKAKNWQDKYTDTSLIADYAYQKIAENEKGNQKIKTN